ncbi:SigE family RNA polymerase sigma factor [Micromonospora yangpuensis]|uniref:RNA polymerase sigma-70 factor, sigma-E family n=1 Tax=Micromonospora yangpuensis TaxID=683228 RepID=A0A1C6VH72_9ACTN|nr:SigE family RNA polymerase sigma factor [Micromonospora yangpuensis]GGL99612.1 RNA polymerase sigma24 factor [Micromonospora yangpuensis]SCL65683.1 RNA polymerase sigma-70 factor, sigma-E family [Micromonospora yangpuensis]
MNAEEEEGFRQFVAAQLGPLRKLAYLTCGNWHTAEDAVATALAKLYPRWRKLDRPDLYVKTMVYRAAVDEIRRPWRRERSAGDELPDVALRDPAAGTDERIRVQAALRTVPRKQRAALILRYYLGMTLEESAAVLGVSVGTAKSQTSRGLSRLREVLATESIDLQVVEIKELSRAVA